MHTTSFSIIGMVILAGNIERVTQMMKPQKRQKLQRAARVKKIVQLAGVKKTNGKLLFFLKS